MEYKNFEEFFNTADKLLQFPVCTGGSRLLYMRRVLSKDVLNGFYKLRDLSAGQMILLNTKTPEVKFSIDSMIKNKINHPELIIDDYKKINDIILNPDEIKYSKNKRNCILLFKRNNKKYQAVIKTVITLNENFLTSFRFAEH